MERHGIGMPTPHPGCPVEASPAPGVFVDSRRESKGGIGIPTPPRYPVVASPAPGVFVDSRRESKDGIGMPTPHPGCPVEAFGIPTPPRYFGKRGWICLIPKELAFLATTKRLQVIEEARVKAVVRWEVG